MEDPEDEENSEVDIWELCNRRSLVNDPKEEENSEVEILVDVGISIPVCIEGKNSFCCPAEGRDPLFVVKDLVSILVRTVSSLLCGLLVLISPRADTVE